MQSDYRPVIPFILFFISTPPMLRMGLIFGNQVRVWVVSSSKQTNVLLTLFPKVFTEHQSLGFLFQMDKKVLFRFPLSLPYYILREGTCG